MASGTLSALPCGVAIDLTAMGMWNGKQAGREVGYVSDSIRDHSIARIPNWRLPKPKCPNPNTQAQTARAPGRELCSVNRLVGPANGGHHGSAVPSTCCRV